MCYLTDLGTEFENELARELYKLLGIDKLRSSGYRPQTAGALERWHRVLNSMLGKVVPEHQRVWPSLLSYVMFCYNASCHSATRYSPFFLMTGRDPHWNIGFHIGQPSKSISNFCRRVCARGAKSFGHRSQDSQTKPIDTCRYGCRLV